MADKKDKMIKSFIQFVRDEQSKADADKGRKILKDVQDKLKDRVKKADGGEVRSKKLLKEFTDHLNKTEALNERYAVAEQKLIEKKLREKPLDPQKLLKEIKPTSGTYSVAEQKMIEKKLDERGRVKKADGGIVLKQATDDRNRTPNKGVCRGGGAAIKGIKFSGVK